VENISITKKDYKEMVEKMSPNSHLVKDCIKAFIVGGLICDLGQLITNTLVNMNFPKDESSMITTIILVFIGSLLTSLGIYEKLGKFAGAGSLVPITGFSNSVTAPAIEFKKEGFIFGVGSRMFVIAGPVLLYGILSSFVVGFIYYFASGIVIK